MKKFTCLLVALLAVGIVIAPCPTPVANINGFQLRLDQIAATTSIHADATGVNNAAGSCGATAGAIKVCCDDTKVKAAVTGEINKVKTQFTDFGSAVARIGGLWGKLWTLTNASTVNTTLDTAQTADLSGASTTLFKTWATWTGAMFDTDFTAYKSQVVGCYDHYALAVQKIACGGCVATHADSAPMIADATIPITQASCNDWVSKCHKVWAFHHKLGWFVQIVAFLNKKKEATAGAVTFTAPASTAVYAAGLTSVADVDAGVMACAADAAASGCTDTIKGNLCKAFIGVWSVSTGVSVGRTDKTFIQSSYNPVSTVARRLLPPAITTGAITISAATGSIDTTTTNALVFPPTAPIATIDPAAWSSGYVAPATNNSTSNSSNNSSSTTTANKSSAQVLIGTVLSAIFAVALLN